jgi:hypothetical protein
LQASGYYVHNKCTEGFNHACRQCHVIARILPPVDTKSEAISSLKQLRKNCKIDDVISPLNEEWDAEK